MQVQREAILTKDTTQEKENEPQKPRIKKKRKMTKGKQTLCRIKEKYEKNRNSTKERAKKTPSLRTHIPIAASTGVLIEQKPTAKSSQHHVLVIY